MLSDKKSYEELNTDPPKTDKIKYNNFLKKCKEHLVENETDYLSNSEIKSSIFLLPHQKCMTWKDRNVCEESNWPYVDNERDLKLRAVVAGRACLTHRLSNLIDILFRPLTKPIKSDLRGTTDF